MTTNDAINARRRLLIRQVASNVCTLARLFAEAVAAGDEQAEARYSRRLDAEVLKLQRLDPSHELLNDGQGIAS